MMDRNMKQIGSALMGEDGKELIRCKDCKYCNKHDYMCEHPNEWGNEDTRNQCNPEWFCADGKKRDHNDG